MPPSASGRRHRRFGGPGRDGTRCVATLPYLFYQTVGILTPITVSLNRYLRLLLAWKPGKSCARMAVLTQNNRSFSTMAAARAGREHLVQQALQLFKLHGYHNTTMADVGKAAGLLKGSVYYYFDGKEQLAVEAMRHVRASSSKQIFSLAYDESRSPRERLANLTQAVEDYFIDSEGGCLMGNLALETINTLPQFAQLIRAYFDEWRQALVHLLRSQYEQDRAGQLAQDAVARIEGAIMIMRIDGDPAVLRRANRDIATWLR
ncbi:MAG: hypothetical protein BRC44_13665 [Cyanobacteria bacterium QS_4_48_99]|nr:MAG: hypothetical protein BRC44_13665 [Cyanobacteria bacterium QS_4_48_99]